MNYYPFHIGDYIAHTMHLSPIEDIAYRRLLDRYYLTEAPLTTDVTKLARLVRLDGHEAEVRSALDEFFVLTDEGWRHDRCDEEIGRMQDKQVKARASAAASVSARRAKAEKSNDRLTSVERPLNVRSTNVELPTPTPIERERKPRKAAATRLTEVVLPHEWANYCRQNRPDLDPALVFTLFRNFWTAKKGGDAEKLDWYATWQNWVIREKPTPNVAAKKSGVLAL